MVALLLNHFLKLNFYRNILPSTSRQKFIDLFGERGTSLTFKIEKEGSEIKNKDEFNRFIASIAFYMVAFNSIVLIREGNRQSRLNYNYGLFASQNQLFGNEYITGLGSHTFSRRFALSPTGEDIYNTWKDIWNRQDNKKNGKIVWNYEDCWPIHLFKDERILIDKFIEKFNLGGSGIDKLI